jgi:hypothetical protein
MRRTRGSIPPGPRNAQCPYAGEAPGQLGRLSGLCGRAVVAMVQPIDLWDRDDAPGRRRHDGPRGGRVLVEAQMRP